MLLLFHYKGGCLLRCADVDCPTRSSVAVVMHDFDAGILPNTFINF